MSSQHALNREVDVDLGSILANVWRWKVPILLSGILAAALAFAVVSTIKPRFQAQVSILIQDNDDVLTTKRDQVNPVSQATDKQGIASQVGLIKSQSLARRVIQKLKLDRNPEFSTALQSPVSKILSLVGFGSGPTKDARQNKAMEAYFDRLQAYQMDPARIVVIEFWAHDRLLATQIANGIADEYIAFQEELKRGVEPASLKKLEPELDRQRQKVLDAEARVAEFRAASGLLSNGEKGGLAERDLTQLSTALSNARADLSKAKAHAEAVERAVQSGSLASAGSVLSSPIIQKLREQQSNLQSTLAALNTKLLPKHPKVIGAKSQIAQVQRQLRSEMNKILRSLRAEVETVRARERDLSQKRNTLKAEVAREEEASVGLRELQREAKAEAQLLNDYLVKFKEAASRQNRDFLPADARIVSAAQPATQPFFPKVGLILIGSFVGAILLAAMIVLVGGILRGAPALRNEHTIDNWADGVAEDGMAPSVDPAISSMQEAGASHRIQADAPTIAPMDLPQFNPEKAATTPANLMMVARSLTMLDRARVVLVSPSETNPSGGAIGLARLLASVGPTVLVDMTGDGHASNHMLGTLDKPGIKEVLAGMLNLGNAVNVDRVSAAHIVPTGGTAVGLSAESVSKLPLALDTLQKTYRYVLLDVGTVGAASVQRVMTPSTGIVVATGTTGLDQARTLANELAGQGNAAPVVMQMDDQSARAVGLQATPFERQFG